MRKQWDLWFVILAFLSFLAILSPQQSFAQQAPTPPTTAVSTSGLSDPTVIALAGRCKDGKEDKTYQTNASATAQERYTLGTLVKQQFYTIPASMVMQCVQTIGSIFEALGTAASSFAESDPRDIAALMAAAYIMAISAIIQQVINSVCQQVLSTITSAISAAISYASICLPLPAFNPNLDLPRFQPVQCGLGSGAFQFNAITGQSSVTVPATYDPSLFYQ